MRVLPLIDSASWKLVNQGIVGAGNFMLSVPLARYLRAANCGSFALFVGAIFFSRAIDCSLISYPLSVRRCRVAADERGDLLGNAALRAAALSPTLMALLAVGFALVQRAELTALACLCFLCWQSQDALRRCLLADLRDRAAAAAVSYVGQALAVAGLA
jgi:hypothetical protein